MGATARLAAYFEFTCVGTHQACSSSAADSVCAAVYVRLDFIQPLLVEALSLLVHVRLTVRAVCATLCSLLKEDYCRKITKGRCLGFVQYVISMLHDGTVTQHPSGVPTLDGGVWWNGLQAGAQQQAGLQSEVGTASASMSLPFPAPVQGCAHETSLGTFSDNYLVGLVGPHV